MPDDFTTGWSRTAESETVFMDVDMAPDVDFVDRITEAVAACHVLIVVMGPRWATVADEQGRRRIADPEDFVGSRSRRPRRSAEARIPTTT